MEEMVWLVRRMALNTVKNYKIMLLYLCLPVLGITLASLIHSDSGESSLKIGIINLDGGQKVAGDMVAQLSKLQQVNVREISAEESEELLQSGAIDTAITLPEGFSDSMLTEQPSNVLLASVQGSQAAVYMKSYVNAYVDNLAAIGKASGGEREKFDELYQSLDYAEAELTTNSVEDLSSQHRKSIQSLGYLIMLMLFAAVNMTALILKEKENRTLFRLFASPISGRAYVGANVVVNVVVMLIQIIITLAVMTQLFRMDAGIPVVQLFLLLGLFSLVAVSLALTIVAFSSSSSAANGIQTMIIIPSCLLAGCLFPIATMPAYMQPIAQFLPQFWLLDMVSQLQQGVALSGVALNAAILLAFALAFSLTAAYKFGRNKELNSFI